MARQNALAIDSQPLVSIPLSPPALLARGAALIRMLLVQGVGVASSIGQQELSQELFNHCNLLQLFFETYFNIQ